MESFVATAWNRGDHLASGNGYGLKLSARDRDAHLRREWGSVDLHLGGREQPTRVNVDKPSLWTDPCRELISREIGEWLIAAGKAPWPRGVPPRLRLTARTQRAFDVALT